MANQKLLAAPQEALWNYLDALLQEIPPDLLPADGAEEEIQEWDPAALEVAAAPAVALPELPLQTAVLPQVAPVVVPESGPAVAAGDTAAAADAGARPAWADGEFQALLFSVGGLNLAVPLVTLHSVLPWPEQGVTPMPNQPDWCFGLLRYRERNVRVVDTGTMVIPPDRKAAVPVEPPQHILIVGDGDWGLACNTIGSVVRLGAEDVRWRASGGQRPWLAGTVLAHLCALIDTQAFAQMLAAGHRPGSDKPRPRRQAVS
jgi:purine-binding chemotaxis protein CheW